MPQLNLTLPDQDKLEVFSRFGRTITIDHSRDVSLTEFGKATLKDSYLLKGETYQQLFARVACAYGNDSDHSQRIYNYMSWLWFMPATPVLSNGGTDRGLPISCFLNEVEDSLKEIVNTWAENAWLAAMGGGLGSYWGAVREIGAACGLNGKTSGIIPFLKVNDSLTLAISQGSLRRGSSAVYLDDDHPEVEEFIEIRKSSGDFNRKSLNIHHGLLITDKFMEAVEAGLPWNLISRKTGEVVKTLDARTLFAKIVDTRMATGEPYMIFIDTVNAALPAHQKALGLKVKLSNLCTEIFLATGLDHLMKRRSAVCCLSSTNHEKYEEWENDPMFIPDVLAFLDNVLQDFIDRAPTFINEIRDSLIEPLLEKLRERITDEAFLNEVKAVLNEQLDLLSNDLPRKMEQAVYSATRERSVGLGNMGFAAFLQMKGIPYESQEAVVWNKRIHKHIKKETVRANRLLMLERGPCPDSLEAFERGLISEDQLVRLSHTTATAPTASISIICGQTSACHESQVTNYYTHKTKSGSFAVRNKALKALMERKGIDTEEFWSSILGMGGSVLHLGPMREKERTLFNNTYQRLVGLLNEHAVDITSHQAVEDFIQQLTTAVEVYEADRMAQADGVRGWAAEQAPRLLAQLHDTAAGNDVPLIDEDGSILNSIRAALATQERAKIESMIPPASPEEEAATNTLYAVKLCWAELGHALNLRMLEFSEVWTSLVAAEGNPDQFAYFSLLEADIFKTAFEIDQLWAVDHMADRTEDIDQGSSLNLFMQPDVHKYTAFMVHFRAWKKKCKSLYYLRSDSIAKTSMAGGPVSSDNTVDKPTIYAEAKKYEECAACQ